MEMQSTVRKLTVGNNMAVVFQKCLGMEVAKQLHCKSTVALIIVVDRRLYIGQRQDF